MIKSRMNSSYERVSRLPKFSLQQLDPKQRDMILSYLLDITIIMNKWIDYETNSMQTRKNAISKQMTTLEVLLPDLYLDGLNIICAIHRSLIGRFKQTSAFAVPLSNLSSNHHTEAAFNESEWELQSNEFKRKDAACTEQKTFAESALKRQEENRKILEWIKRADDPEPPHKTIKEKTGLDDLTTKAGNWFLDTIEFAAWVQAIGSNDAKNRIFWLNGISM